MEQQQLLILARYKREIEKLGINSAGLDESMRDHLSDYLDKFI
jgi:hypothetical protein